MKPEKKDKKYSLEMESPPITHRVFSITGFVFSGWIYFTDSRFKIPSEEANCFACFMIPEGNVIDVYTMLEKMRKTGFFKCQTL